jgi:PadR family transcriptional regulator, regulatory protein PadR
MTLKRARKPDALQGTLDLLVLRTLQHGPQHGYGIVTHLQAVTDAALRVEEGSLYPALHRMEQSGWITASWETTANNRRARVYRLTRQGQKRLADEQEKWARLSEAVGKVLRFSEA